MSFRYLRCSRQSLLPLSLSVPSLSVFSIATHFSMSQYASKFLRVLFHDSPHLIHFTASLSCCSISFQSANAATSLIVMMSTLSTNLIISRFHAWYPVGGCYAGCCDTILIVVYLHGNKKRSHRIIEHPSQFFFQCLTSTLAAMHSNAASSLDLSTV